MKSTPASASAARSFAAALAVLAVLLGVLFAGVLAPQNILFSNDGPFGLLVAQEETASEAFTGHWRILNWLGREELSAPPNLTMAAFFGLGGATGFAKIYTPAALLFFGVCVWYFCRRSGFSAPVALIAGIAAALNSNAFSYACWGLAAKVIAFGAIFLALGLLARQEHGLRQWLRVALAGFAIGMNIMEAADLGALLSLFFAAFVLYDTLVNPPSPSPLPKRLLQGALTVGIVATLAAWLSAHALTSLVGTQVKGVAVTQQSEKSAERWAYATGWSYPKLELVRLLVPGILGYRMDSPSGGAYWGRVGEDGSPPRFSGSGEYPGLLVLLIAGWAVFRSLKPQSSASQNPFTEIERRRIWFWAAAGFVSTLLAFGHFAPFYQLIYPLPFFSTIRIPMKFLHLLHLCLIILFAHGLEGLVRLSAAQSGASIASPFLGLSKWWRSLATPDRRFVGALAALTGLATLAALVYSSSSRDIVAHLNRVPPMAGTPEETARHSINEVWFSLALWIACAAVVSLWVSRWFSSRISLALALTGGLLAADLLRANSPWVILINYQQRYQSNPVVDLLKSPPTHAGRVSAFLDPRRIRFENLGLPPANEFWYALHNLWLEHHFQFYKIQTLDIIQMPRMPDLDKQYLDAFLPTNAASAHWITRRWELSNTRYLLGSSTLGAALDAAVDSNRHRFTNRLEFTIAPKPNAPPNLGATASEQLDNVTAVAQSNGPLAVVEFLGALPRAQFFHTWEQIPDNTQTLQRLRDPQFNPHQSVVVQEAPNLPKPVAPGAPATASPASITDYQPRHISVKLKADAPGILLLNDRWHPDWKVTVNGQPAPLLRANFLMRGVALPAGDHTVDFRFQPATGPLWVSLSAVFASVVLLAAWVIGRPKPGANSPGSSPISPAGTPSKSSRNPL